MGAGVGKQEVLDEKCSLPRSRRLDRIIRFLDP